MPIALTPQPGNNPPRVLLDVTVVQGTTVNVLRNDPDGRTRPVRTAEPANLTAGAWTGFDYEAPFGAAVTYTMVFDRAQQVHLLTANQFGFETSTAGWLGFGNTTIAQSTAAARNGSASMSLTAVADGAVQATTNTSPTADPPVIAATPGVTYYGSIYFRAAVTARNVRVQMSFFDSGGTQLGSSIIGTAVTNTTTGWTQATVEATAPDNTARMTMVVVVLACVAGEVHYVDDATLHYMSDAPQDSTATTLDVPDVWLIHPGVPAMSVRIPAMTVGRLEDRARSARAAVHQPLGRATPIVVNDVRPSPSAGMEVLTETLEQRDAMWALLNRGIAVLVNIPPALGWGVTYEWAAIGDVTESHFNRGLSTARIFNLPYQVVDRPVGGLLAQWTYSDVLANYSTYSQVLAAYATYSDLLSNTQS